VPVAEDDRVDTRIFQAELDRVLVRGGGSPPVMSTGLPAAPNGGMNLRNAASRSSGIVISDSPLSTHASDSSTPEPPAPVMMTTFSPVGVGSFGMPRANSSSRAASGRGSRLLASTSS
jgi:hypothetical protein